MISKQPTCASRTGWCISPKYFILPRGIPSATTHVRIVSLNLNFAGFNASKLVLGGLRGIMYLILTFNFAGGPGCCYRRREVVQVRGNSAYMHSKPQNILPAKDEKNRFSHLIKVVITGAS